MDHPVCLYPLYVRTVSNLSRPTGQHHTVVQAWCLRCTKYVRYNYYAVCHASLFFKLDQGLSYSLKPVLKA